MIIIRKALGIANRNLIPRFHPYNDNIDHEIIEKIKDVAACTFVILAGVISFLAFPHLTMAGFIAGHFFRRSIREGAGELWQTFWKVDTVSKVILGICAFACWPYLYLAVPSLIGSYVGWQVHDRTAEDNFFFYPTAAPA